MKGTVVFDCPASKKCLDCSDWRDDMGDGVPCCHASDECHRECIAEVNKITPQKLIDLQSQVDDNMADNEVGPLLDHISRQHANLEKLRANRDRWMKRYMRLQFDLRFASEWLQSKVAAAALSADTKGDGSND